MSSETVHCPDCNAAMIGGPRGGLAQNFYCSNRQSCRQGFNLTIWQGQMVMPIHRIGEVDDELYAMYAGAQ
jgi:hypothetical protein